MVSNTNLPSVNAEDENEKVNPFYRAVLMTGRLMIIPLLIAVYPNNGEARADFLRDDMSISILDRNSFLDFSNLVDADWEEIEEKLGVVLLNDFKKLLKTLSVVANDSKALKEAKIRKSLRSGNLDTTQKETFLSLAKKYNLDTVPAIKAILDKENISPKSIIFLDNQCSSIIRRFIEVCDKYIKIREWMLGKGHIKANDRKLRAFKALKKDLEKRLSGNSGNTSSVNGSHLDFMRVSMSNNNAKKTPILTSFGRNDDKSVGRVRM